MTVESRWWRRPKIVAVFAAAPDDAARAVAYVRREVPDLPVWLFTGAPPAGSVAHQCEQVFLCRTGLAVVRAIRRMAQARWMALGVTAWTGSHGAWLFKLTPLLTPPFRTLVMNEHGGFFSPTLGMLARHWRERAWQALTASPPSLAVQNVWHRVRVAIWCAGLAVRDRSKFYWRWWPVLLKNWWEPKRVKLVYGVYYRLVAMWLDTWRRVKDIYWAIADPCEKRGFSLTRLASGLLHVSWARPAEALLASFYPTVQKRFTSFAAHPHGPAASLPTVRTSGDSIDVFRYGTKRWRRGLLDQLTNASSARCLLLLRDGAEPGDLTDLLPLFDDPHTFAVARQTETRAWDRSLFCRAPFRQLQPGEVSPVLAPLAPAILIDRAKLHALGVPRAWFPQSALLMLYWRASAAGWRSYQVGGTTPTTQSWRCPTEETEAALRLMRSHAPVPDTRLVWGNTATVTSTGTVTLISNRPRVLIVSPYLPYPLSHGGAVRIYNLCRALSSHVDFLLASFREMSDVVHYDKLSEIFREVYVVDRDEPLNPDESLPMQVRGQQSRAMEALVEELCRTRGIDIVQIEYTHLAPLRRHTAGRPAILVEHDITFSLYKQMADKTPSPAAQAEYERWRRFEHHWFTAYESVWTMSAADRDLALSAGAPAARTWVVANGVDLERFKPEPVISDAPEVFFVGSFRHYPNILGFEQLWKEVMPRIWKEFPGARLRVVAGPDPEHYWKELKKEPYPSAFDSRIVLHGFVEDLRPLYARASAVAMPLLVSAGTNIKLMEAMACGKAVVSTAVGCAGLGLQDGHDLLIRDTSDGFVDALRQLLAGAALRDTIGRQARHTAEQQFGWANIADEAYRSYAALAAE